jgi:hypothetical protein
LNESAALKKMTEAIAVHPPEDLHLAPRLQTDDHRGPGTMIMSTSVDMFTRMNDHPTLPGGPHHLVARIMAADGSCSRRKGSEKSSAVPLHPACAGLEVLC